MHAHTAAAYAYRRQYMYMCTRDHVLTGSWLKRGDLASMASLLEECVCVRVCSLFVLVCFDASFVLCAGKQLKSGDLAIIASLLEKKTIKVVIDSTYSLYEIDKAHERSETHRARGKIVVQVCGALTAVLLCDCCAAM